MIQYLILSEAVKIVTEMKIQCRKGNTVTTPIKMTWAATAANKTKKWTCLAWTWIISSRTSDWNQWSAWVPIEWTTTITTCTKTSSGSSVTPKSKDIPKWRSITIYKPEEITTIHLISLQVHRIGQIHWVRTIMKWWILFQIIRILEAFKGRVARS